jgi:hypothetical protein
VCISALFLALLGLGLHRVSWADARSDARHPLTTPASIFDT